MSLLTLFYKYLKATNLLSLELLIKHLALLLADVRIQNTLVDGMPNFYIHFLISFHIFGVAGGEFGVRCFKSNMAT